MSRRIVIAGMGGFGRGVHAWLLQSPRHLASHEIDEIVFIDDGDPAAPAPAPRIGTIREFIPKDGDELIVAVGVPSVRRAIVAMLSARATRFHTFIDDRAIVAPSVRVRTGAVICPGAVISANAIVGEHVHINFNCSVGHDASLGEFTTLSPAVNVMGSVDVGNDVFLGGSSTVLPRLSITNHVVIGAGAVVVSSVSRSITVVGNPAKELIQASNGQLEEKTR